MKRKYPWEKWFGDGFAVLLRGVDYHVSQSSMMQAIRNRASASGLKLEMKDTGTEIMFTVVGRRDAIPHTKARVTVSEQRQGTLAQNGTN